MLKEYVVVDLEMTGLKPARDKVLEIGAVRVSEGQILKELSVLVNPGIEIPENITELTGITNDMAKEGIKISEAMEQFLEFREDLPLVGHNILYDYGFLVHNAVNCNMKLETKVLDTLKLSRMLLAEPEKKTLESLCNYFGIVRDKKHRALDDAKATAKLFEILQEGFIQENQKLFEPYAMPYKVKKQGPITPSQKRYLKELKEYHKIELSMDIDSLTRNEASRLTDQLISRYGKCR